MFQGKKDIVFTLNQFINELIKQTSQFINITYKKRSNAQYHIYIAFILIHQFLETFLSINHILTFFIYTSLEQSIYYHFTIIYLHHLLFIICFSLWVHHLLLVPSHTQSFMSITTDDYLSDIKLQYGKTLSENVSSIDWSLNAPDHFACTLWDGTLKIYQVCKPPIAIGFKNDPPFIKEKASISITTPYPLTYCAWSPDGNAIFLGTSKGQVKALDTNSCNVIDVARHPAPINYIKFIPEYGNTLLTSAYEHNVHFWNMNNPLPVKTLTFGKKIYRASYNNQILATSLSDEKIGLVNIKALHKKNEFDSSELGKHSQIQTINVSKNGKLFGVGTIDGRVNISYINTSSALECSWKSHITFKAHKTQDKTNPSIVTLYPVNTFTFHTTEESWFSTSGADGTMNYWNHVQKNKIKTFNYNSTPVCCASVSPLGNFMAYALGNDWHMGPQGDQWKPKIAVHQIQQAEMKSFNKK